MNATLEAVRMNARALSADQIGRVVLVQAGPAGVLSDVRKGLFSTKLWVNGRAVKVNNSRSVVTTA